MDIVCKTNHFLCESVQWHSRKNGSESFSLSIVKKYFSYCHYRLTIVHEAENKSLSYRVDCDLPLALKFNFHIHKIPCMRARKLIANWALTYYGLSIDLTYGREDAGQLNYVLLLINQAHPQLKDFTNHHFTFRFLAERLITDIDQTKLNNFYL